MPAPKNSPFLLPNRIGMLGGGQLGRMLIQHGLSWNLPVSVLDPDPQAPCSQLALFTVGKLTDYETVMQFGANCDLITVEIENVSTRALAALEKSGKHVFPQPHLLELIQDKSRQKQFYKDHQIPTADFVLTTNRADVSQYQDWLPVVHKLSREGYDGRGVQIIRTVQDLPRAFDAPGVLEKLIPFEKEISVIVARNHRGEVASFPAVEMVFHPEANLVEYLFAPAAISNAIATEADALARRVIDTLGLVGLLAVEMFVTREGKVLVNEVAPRPHNSGHHTIEANRTSQYEQHWRAILNLQLGDTKASSAAAMVNLLGEDGYSGVARYEGLEQVLAMPGVYVHLYGKTVTKPFRKMGHVTIVDDDIALLRKKVEVVKSTLKVKS
ncbi:MAG: 5-(carboxyamino)imidazole ribonucleotide synthase [Cyclobacteriaceae bacterium]|jgi:5-(carboxyamino)imidazole ribonucleotide synthase|nr:5-(carboxyamino)imidazole ribonucleotide synthase [Cyclobacteriaceae bacterium]